MAKKRIRIDMEDADGARYDIKLEGNVTRDKVLKIFEMMDSVSYTHLTLPTTPYV